MDCHAEEEDHQSVEFDMFLDNVVENILVVLLVTVFICLLKARVRCIQVCSAAP